MKMDVIAVGALRRGPLFELQEDYRKRLLWPVSLLEVESNQRDPQAMQTHENQLIQKKLQSSAFVIILDERGSGMRSLDFARTLGKLRDNGQLNLQFILGGALGLQEDIRQRADLMLSFGPQTWPHMLARVMLWEQIYRAQTILQGHPYHKES